MLCPLLHVFSVLYKYIYIYRRKQTALALVIFSGDMLQMLHFPVTLYPTLSLYNLSAVKLQWGASPRVSLIRPGKDLADIGSTQRPQALLRAAVLGEMGGALLGEPCWCRVVWR